MSQHTIIGVVALFVIIGLLVWFTSFRMPAEEIEEATQSNAGFGAELGNVIQTFFRLVR